MTRTRLLRVPEKAEQAHGVQLLRSPAVNAEVYVLGGHRRRTDHQGTMQTPGVPDVTGFVPVPRSTAGGSDRVFFWWECKALDGRLRPEQREFRALCLAANVQHIVGGYDALCAWLVGLGVVKASSFPHYRQAAIAAKGASS